MSEDDTIDFLEKHTRIRIEGTHCHYVIFVFSGHGAKGVLESQDGKLMSLEHDIFPLLFKKGHFGNVPKLIFLDTCRSDQKNGRLSLEDSLSSVWKKGMAGYYHLCAAPSGYPAFDHDSGSVFSKVVTHLLCKGVSLSDLQKETEFELYSHARKSNTEAIAVDSHTRELGPLSERNLSKLRAKGSTTSQTPTFQTTVTNTYNVGSSSAVSIGGRNNTTTGTSSSIQPATDRPYHYTNYWLLFFGIVVIVVAGLVYRWQ
jgi:hypothetical protein